MTSSTNPWTATLFVVSVVLAGFAGYRAGQNSKPSAQSLSKKTDTPAPKEPRSGTQKDQSEPESDEEEEARADGDLASVHTNGPCKMASRPGPARVWRN